MKHSLRGIVVVLCLWAVCNLWGQDGEARTRKLWDTTLLNQRQGGSTTSSKQGKAAGAKPVRGLIGVTLWSYRPARPADKPEVRALIHEGSKDTEWTAERIAVDTPLPEGQRVSISIESGEEGYLYVIDQEVYADGTKSRPALIFPTLRTRGGDHRIKPGVVVQIPGPTDTPPFFKMERTRPDQVSENLIVIVSPKRIPGITAAKERILLREDQVAAWEKQWPAKVFLIDAKGEDGKTMTSAERTASSGKPLTASDSVPQSMYLVESRDGDPLMLRVPLKISK